MRNLGKIGMEEDLRKNKITLLHLSDRYIRGIDMQYLRKAFRGSESLIFG